jgi:hypothetical protein
MGGLFTSDGQPRWSGMDIVEGAIFVSYSYATGSMFQGAREPTQAQSVTIAKANPTPCLGRARRVSAHGRAKHP